MQNMKQFYLIEPHGNSDHPMFSLVGTLPEPVVCDTLEEAYEIVEKQAIDILNRIPNTSVAEFDEEDLEEMGAIDENMMMDIYIVDNDDNEIMSFGIMEYDPRFITVH